MAEDTVVKEKVKLGANESLVAKPCPECGGQLVVNAGPGISCTFCLSCDYNEYDYD